MWSVFSVCAKLINWHLAVIYSFFLYQWIHLYTCSHIHNQGGHHIMLLDCKTINRIEKHKTYWEGLNCSPPQNHCYTSFKSFKTEKNNATMWLIQISISIHKFWAQSLIFVHWACWPCWSLTVHPGHYEYSKWWPNVTELSRNNNGAWSLQTSGHKLRRANECSCLSLISLDDKCFDRHRSPWLQST